MQGLWDYFLQNTQVAQEDPRFADVLARELRHLHRDARPACVEGAGSHSSWWSDFRDAGRVFQLELYLGPAAGSAARSRIGWGGHSLSDRE